MRVVCIKKGFSGDLETPKPEIGRIYTVIDVVSDTMVFCFNAARGEFYVLAEFDPTFVFHHSIFIVVKEDQKDERDFKRNYSREVFDNGD